MYKAILGNPPTINHYAQLDTDHLCALVGNNTGNLAFRYAVHQQVGNKAKVIPWGADPRVVNSTCDAAFIPCANQLGEHATETNRLRLVSKLTVPVVAIGLGAQAGTEQQIPQIPHDTVQWVREIAERKLNGQPNIFVRGEFTAEVLDHYGISEGIEVLGCPSFFITKRKNLGVLIQRNIDKGFGKIGVAAGNPLSGELNRVERQIARIACQTGGSYIVQHPPPLIKWARGESVNNESVNRRLVRFISEINGKDGLSSSGSFRTVFFDVQAWMEELRHHDLIVGTRVHGTILALQVGTPALCITHDSRTVELCRTLGIPNIDAARFESDFKTIDDFKRLVRFDPSVFDKNRTVLFNKYRDALLNYGVDIGDLE